MDENKLKYLPLPPNHDGSTYFAVAMANWAINYNEKRRPLDCWYVVRVAMRGDPSIAVLRRVMLSTDNRILGRYRHHAGRLFTVEETYPVVNALNHRPLSVLAASASPGGLSRYIKELSREMEKEEIDVIDYNQRRT